LRVRKNVEILGKVDELNLYPMDFEEFCIQFSAFVLIRGRARLFKKKTIFAAE